MKRLHCFLPSILAFGLLAVAQTASAAPPNPQDADPHTQNVHDMGHELRAATFEVPDGQREIHSDIAFQGKLAFQGNYAGFRILDISAPGNPKLISFPKCNGAGAKAPGSR